MRVYGASETERENKNRQKEREEEKKGNTFDPEINSSKE